MTRPLHIAIAESDDLIRQLVQLWLHDAGHTSDALDAGPVPARRFDLVIANVSSPRSAAAEVRALRAAHGAPLLLLSARFGRTTPQTLAQQLGVAATLAKPFTRQELMAAIDRALP